MDTTKIEQKIRNVYKNFSANFVDNLNTDLTMYLNVENDFYKNRNKNDYSHTATFKNRRIESIKHKNYDFDFEGNTFVERYLYKDRKSFDQIGILSKFLLYGCTNNTRLFLVEMNIPNSCETYDEVEKKIKDIIGNGNELHLTMHEFNLNDEAGNVKNISAILKTNKTKDVMYNFVRMVDDEVQQISNFFSLISFKQFSKRRNSYMDKHYQNFLQGKPNNFKYYMEILFKPQKVNQKIPRFNSEFKFPIKFYNINSDGIHSDTIYSDSIKLTQNVIGSPINDNVSVVSNDTLIANVDGTTNSSPLLLSPSVYSDVTLTNSDNEINAEMFTLENMNLINQLIDQVSIPTTITPFGSTFESQLSFGTQITSSFASPFSSPFASPNLSTVQMEYDQAVLNQNIDVPSMYVQNEISPFIPIYPSPPQLQQDIQDIQYPQIPFSF